MVVNIVDVGWATIKSGCLPITGIEHPPIVFLPLLPRVIIPFKLTRAWAVRKTYRLPIVSFHLLFRCWSTRFTETIKIDHWWTQLRVLTFYKKTHFYTVIDRMVLPTSHSEIWTGCKKTTTFIHVILFYVEGNSVLDHLMSIGEGLEETQFRRLEKMLSTLPTLWVYWTGSVLLRTWVWSFLLTRFLKSPENSGNVLGHGGM
jgi:hypothetical protein